LGRAPANAQPAAARRPRVQCGDQPFRELQQHEPVAVVLEVVVVNAQVREHFNHFDGKVQRPAFLQRFTLQAVSQQLRHLAKTHGQANGSRTNNTISRCRFRSRNRIRNSRPSTHVEAAF
jgi:hypothetical protein